MQAVVRTTKTNNQRLVGRGCQWILLIEENGEAEPRTENLPEAAGAD